ncbi:MAG: phosphodiesterase [Clostridia bacterium]|nr:phosphodiesterase [Clostridia bacterium]
MKWMIASDIHGSALWCERLLEAWRAAAPDRLILLGDLLYHGPRNDLPDAYAPKRVIAMLNAIAPELLCVRGNCEAEVDQMVLSFPVMADYAVMPLGRRLIYMTHGHVFGEDSPPPLKPGDILLCGHTHVPAFRRHDGFIYVNPGSVAIPKDGTPHSFMMLEDGAFTWVDLETGSKWMEARPD